jgi:sulfur carrier protein
MSLFVNGKAQPHVGDRTVAALVAATAPSPKGVAVAVNGEVVPRSAWGTHELHDGDRVELLSARQGG